MGITHIRGKLKCFPEQGWVEFSSIQAIHEVNTPQNDTEKLLE